MSNVGLRGKPVRGQTEEIPSSAAEATRAEINTMMQGEIVDFDAEKQEATVKLLHIPTLNGEEVAYPELKKVPVVFPRGGGYSLTWPIQKGDPIAVTFAQRNIDNWYLDGEAKAAGSKRMHDLSDAVAYPGFMRSQKQKLPGFNTERTELRANNDERDPRLEMGSDLVYLTLGGMSIKMENGKITIKADNILLEGDVDLGAEGGQLVHRKGDVDDAFDTAVGSASKVRAF